MEPFIRSDQFNYIKEQINHLINAHTTVNDSGVLEAMSSLTEEKVKNVFPKLHDHQAALLNKSKEIVDQADAVFFLSQLRAHVIPFPQVSEDKLKNLFPKVKKLKIPVLEGIDLRDISYIGWNDYGAKRKYLVTFIEGDWHGLEGSFSSSYQENICTICNSHEKVGLFSAKIKSSGDHLLKRGNYICQDSMVCNQNISSLHNLHQFVHRMKEASF
ncbi:FusB/FusC family EF-G-binding protein [Halobacillus massiliensis]|uniref:FusB/FusC family EF-G-binding protein n=1 Tax=Halobacillus massiliensis TaxID=1926286 RepID=UPI0009E3E2D4|nr:FusB/FusC family EF-G-binding protein [Halobacillus massiliensis]